MRKGYNPVKVSKTKNKRFHHRIVLPVYIPDSNELYFKNLNNVLKLCLSSLFNSINIENTAVTVINNGSCKETEEEIFVFIDKIDKYVYYNTNKGKVYAVKEEARSCTEDYITITDSDIFFLKNWEFEVFKIFENFPDAGVVSPYPCPYMTFYHNTYVFGKNFINNIRYGKYTKDRDIELYLEGTNLPKLHLRKNKKENWKNKQYVIKNKKEKAVIGAYHVVATYKTFQFSNDYSFNEVVFENSYESETIDNKAKLYGLNRLSTINNFIYHIGNEIQSDNNIDTLIQYNENLIRKDFEFNSLPKIKKRKYKGFWVLFFNLIGKKLKKILE